MQAYSKHFAQVYDLLWGNFANTVAPRIREFYEQTEIGSGTNTPANHHMLDLCCGTGHLSRHFLEHSYSIVGLDLSDEMLSLAREKNRDYIVAQQARFVQGDAANFQMAEKFGLAVSTFDALNHLPDESALQGCFRSTFEVLESGGYFIFDLNTRSGLQRWNGVNIHNTEEIFLLNRSIYDELTVKAWTKITGFIRNEDGFYERFDETVYNIVYDMDKVMEWVVAVGFSEVYPAAGADLQTSLEDPEKEGRVFFVAVK